MKTNTFYRQALGILFLSFLTISCSDDDPTVPAIPVSNSIADIASRNSDFSILVSALDRADLVATLDGEGPYTVFAPTNAAFSAFLAANGYNTVTDIPINALKEILLNHVIAGNYRSTQLQTGYLKTLGKGGASASNTLSMYVNSNSGVMLNGGTANNGASVTTADVLASNGVIHVVNAVIGLPTVVNHAIANPDFAILVQALTRGDQPDFVGILSGTSGAPFTVFAPANSAFTNLLAELGLSSLSDIPQATLENTLKYHVVAGANVQSNNLSNNLSVATFQGQSFTVNVTGGPKITDANARISNIVATDVQASNGIIHAIDKVLLPNL